MQELGEAQSVREAWRNQVPWNATSSSLASLLGAELSWRKGLGAKSPVDWSTRSRGQTDPNGRTTSLYKPGLQHHLTHLQAPSEPHSAPEGQLEDPGGRARRVAEHTTNQVQRPLFHPRMPSAWTQISIGMYISLQIPSPACFKNPHTTNMAEYEPAINSPNLQWKPVFFDSCQIPLIMNLQLACS